MNLRQILLLVCLLGFSSLAFAGLDITYENVDTDGFIIPDEPSDVVVPANAV